MMHVEDVTFEDLLERSMPEPMTGCILWVRNRYVAGYGQFTIGSRKLGYRNYYAHRLAWQTKNGPIPEGIFVLHKCDTPPCINPDHLFLGTKKDNTHDMIAKGRDWHPRKLSDDQVYSIRAMSKMGIYTQHKLAVDFGVSDALVSMILSGKARRRALASSD